MAKSTKPRGAATPAISRADPVANPVPEAAAAPRPRGRRETMPHDARGIIVRVSAAGHRAIRLLAVEEDTSINALMIEAINDLLRKYQRPPVAL